MKTTILGIDDVRHIVQRVGLDALMDEMISRLTVAFREYDPKKIQVPARAGFCYTHPTLGLLEWMPVLDAGRRATIKMVGCHPANPRVRNLPTIMSTIGLFDTDTGHLAGLVDGNFVTALRTGAASAVASRVLASPESRTLGLIGCGTQAVTQFHALTRVFDFDRVLVFDIERSVSHTFIDRVSELHPDRVVVTPVPREEIERAADILCTQTTVESGAGPVLDAENVPPWIHINAVGADFPGKAELPLPVLLQSFVCPDFRPQAVTEGECQQLVEDHPERIGPALADVVQSADRYEFAREQTSVFDSTGFALEDHVAVDMMLDYGADLGVGADFDIECLSSDPRNPYGFLTTSRSPGVRGQAHAANATIGIEPGR